MSVIDGLLWGLLVMVLGAAGLTLFAMKIASRGNPDCEQNKNE